MHLQFQHGILLFDMDDFFSFSHVFFLILLSFTLGLDIAEYDSLHILRGVFNFHLKMFVLVLKASNLLKFIFKKQLQPFDLIFVFGLKALEALRLLSVNFQFFVKSCQLVGQSCDFCLFVFDLCGDINEVFLEDFVLFVEMEFFEVELVVCSLFVLKVYLLIFEFFLGLLLYSVTVCLKFLDFVL